MYLRSLLAHLLPDDELQVDYSLSLYNQNRNKHNIIIIIYLLHVNVTHLKHFLCVHLVVHHVVPERDAEPRLSDRPLRRHQQRPVPLVTCCTVYV